MKILSIALMAMLISLSGCKEEKLTGAEDVRWDREICARCAMALSDRNYSAQVRGGREGKKSKLYKFDDLGCAVIWLDKQNWKDAPRTEVWVNDASNGQWINAKTASYVKVKNSPMDYGLAAHATAEAGAMDYNAAAAHIRHVEERFSQHSAQPLIEPPDLHPQTSPVKE